MLNPDGVVAGNSRTSLAGVDLNRRWGHESIKEETHPSIFALKSALKRDKAIAFIDLHGHTKKYGCFFYGNPGDQKNTITEMI